MLPILFHIGPLAIHSYGLMVLTGFLLALYYTTRLAKGRMIGHKPDERGIITPDHVFDMAMVALFASIIGARALYVLLNLHEYRQHPMEIFKIWSGGLSIHGAIVVGILWLWYYCRKKKLQFLEFADICAPAFALGYAIGRIGCFLNGCCYGSECSLPWGVVFPDAGSIHRHPTQIYATIINLCFFVLLDRLIRRKPPQGVVFFSFLALYCIYRFVDEIFRKGATAEVMALGITQAQVFSLVCLPIVLVMLWRKWKRKG